MLLRERAPAVISPTAGVSFCGPEACSAPRKSANPLKPGGPPGHIDDDPRHCRTSRLCIGLPTATSLVLEILRARDSISSANSRSEKTSAPKNTKGRAKGTWPSARPLPLPYPRSAEVGSPELLSLIRATSLPGSAPQAPGHAVARDH